MASRPMAWADLRLTLTTLITGVAQNLDILENAPTVDTLTVVRIVGDFFMMYSPNSTVVDSLSITDVGIGVASLEAFNAGGTSLPKPSAETEYPARGWLYCNSMPVSQQAESTGVLNTQAHYKFDLGGMRKIDKGILFLSLQQTDILVGGNMRVIGRVRALCKT